MTDEKPSYYQRNRLQRLEVQKQYNKENSERIKEYQKEYFQRNKDRLKAKRREYRLKNPKPTVKRTKKQKIDTLTKIREDIPLLPVFFLEPEPRGTVIYTNKPIIVTFD